MVSSKQFILCLIVSLLFVGCSREETSTGSDSESMTAVEQEADAEANDTSTEQSGNITQEAVEPSTYSSLPPLSEEREETERDNQPPQINDVTLANPRVYRGVDVELVPEVVDADGDDITLSYQWFINDAELTGDYGAKLPGDAFTKGDRVSFTLTAVDQSGDGQTFSGSFIVPNAPPRVTSNIDTRFQGDTLNFTVEATDADDDPLTYSLAGASEGMAIDPETGEFNWTRTAMAETPDSIQIIVTDPEGSQATLELTVQPGEATTEQQQ